MSVRTPASVDRDLPLLEVCNVGILRAAYAKKQHHRFSGIDSGQRRKCIRVYLLLQGEGVMDRSVLPVSACLTRRNGCTVPPSTMQKIS